MPINFITKRNPKKLLKDLNIGETFKQESDNIYMKTDKCAEGKILVVCLNSGTISGVDPDRTISSIVNLELKEV